MRTLLGQGRRGARQMCRALHIATEPNRTLRVNGACPNLIVRTNMETYTATVDATVDGAAASDESIEPWACANADGDLTVTVPPSCASATVSVPASFNVSVSMDGTSAVEVQGWLEGTVDVLVGEGSVDVGTVRGLLTRVHTGRGDVAIKHVEGNVEVVAGGGSVSLGKILAQDVRVAASGELRCTALYSKVLNVDASGGMHSSVLSAEDGTLRLGGTSSLDSAEGEFSIELPAGCEQLTLQAIEGLRRLSIDSVGSVEASGAPDVTINMPEAFRARAQVAAASLSIDERLEAQRTSASDGGDVLVEMGMGEKNDSRAARRRAPPPPTEMTIHVPASAVTFSQMSWMEQRMKASLAAKGEAEAKGRKRGAF
jgi:hypothetical protein